MGGKCWIDLAFSGTAGLGFHDFFQQLSCSRGRVSSAVSGRFRWIAEEISDVSELLWLLRNESSDTIPGLTHDKPLFSSFQSITTAAANLRDRMRPGVRKPRELIVRDRAIARASNGGSASRIDCA
jgi:hypothetical protein